MTEKTFLLLHAVSCYVFDNIDWGVFHDDKHDNRVVLSIWRHDESKPLINECSPTFPYEPDYTETTPYGFHIDYYFLE